MARSDGSREGLDPDAFAKAKTPPDAPKKLDENFLAKLFL